MKFQSLILVTALFVSSLSLANDDLKAIMKPMGNDFKALGLQINNASKISPLSLPRTFRTD